MTIRRRSGLKCKALLLVGMLTMGSGGCVAFDNPAAVWATGVGIGLMDGLISTSTIILGEAIGDIFFPNR